MSVRTVRPLDVPDHPDVSFRAGLGLYFGTLAAGLVLVGGVWSGASTGAVVATFPNVLTFVTVAGAVLSKHAVGLPERIGRSRWRLLACGLPSLAFLALPVAVAYSPVAAPPRFVLASLVGAILTAGPAIGVAAMARNRYVDALTPDEPVATLPWTNSIQSKSWSVFGAIVLVAGGALFLQTGDPRGLLWAGYGLLLVAIQVGRQFEIDWLDGDWQRAGGEIRVHETGLVRRRPLAKSFVPWEAVAGVRLTDDELVIERGWFDLRCERSELDDPEATLATVEQVWRGSGGSRTG